MTRLAIFSGALILGQHPCGFATHWAGAGEVTRLPANDLTFISVSQ